MSRQTLSRLLSGHLVTQAQDARGERVEHPLVQPPTQEPDEASAVLVLDFLGEPHVGAQPAVVTGEDRVARRTEVGGVHAEHLKVEQLQLHQPSLDDVFLAKTGRTLEGAAEEEDEGRPRGGLAMEPA